MRVILQKPVDKLGVPGDIVEVADGYARNYLVPRGLAVKATKGGVKHIDSLKRAHSVRVNKAKAEAEQVASRLAGTPIKVKAHAGEEGRLFGSVTAADIAEAMSRWCCTQLPVTLRARIFPRSDTNFRNVTTSL
jgi:large subunit ribosomal protein L9